jgi:hypothetical protein
MQNYWQMAQNIDPRRVEMAAFANDNLREILSFIICFDNELWLANKRSKEPMIARIRLQYIFDEIQNLKEQKPTNIQILGKFSHLKFNDRFQFLQKLEQLIISHIAICEGQESKIALPEIWRAYFNLVLLVSGAGENQIIANNCAHIIASANHNGFFYDASLLKEINSELKTYNPQIRNNILAAIGFVKLAKSPKTYNNLLDMRLGIRAKFALLGVVLFNKI